ncbi:hypothetical protein OESDEN_00869, partial [Oesophagostomum dentatum]
MSCDCYYRILYLYSGMCCFFISNSNVAHSHFSWCHHGYWIWSHVLSCYNSCIELFRKVRVV